MIALASCLFEEGLCPHIWEAIRGIQSIVKCRLLLGTFWAPHLLTLPCHRLTGTHLPRINNHQRSSVKRHVRIRY